MVENIHSSWSDSFGTETHFIASVRYIPGSCVRSILRNIWTHPVL